MSVSIVPVLFPLEPVVDPDAVKLKQYLVPALRLLELKVAVVDDLESNEIPGQAVVPEGISAVFVDQPDEESVKSLGNVTATFASVAVDAGVAHTKPERAEFGLSVLRRSIAFDKSAPYEDCITKTKHNAIKDAPIKYFIYIVNQMVDA